MISASSSPSLAPDVRLRLDTLVRLRWLAVIGQSIAVAGVHFGLGFSLPFGLCFLLIAVSAWLNIALRIRFPMSHRLSLRAAAALLAYDLTQLAGLLYLTGGLTNPFAILFMAPVMISATSLPPRHTMALGALAVAFASLLAVQRLPLPWEPGLSLEMPFTYIIGIWTSIVLGIAFTAIYTWRVSDESRALAQALSATEFVLAREQHLTQLDGLAAAAAHELGTPLATIVLVTKEMARETPPGTPLADDVALLREQAERCRGILRKLTSLGADGDAGPLEQLALGLLVEEVAGPHRPFGVPITVTHDGDGPQPVCRRNPGVIYALGNIVDNAVDFATTAVSINLRWTSQIVEIVVRDDGPGFAPDVLLRIGEPYITTRGAGRNHADEPARGLGLGLFIARSLIERTDAALHMSNAAPPGHGAVISIRWPRQAFERDTGPGAAAFPAARG